MGAYVEEKFVGGFILDEGKLRKIADLIERRCNGASLVYKVHRGDSYSYETSVIDDVVNEDNEDWRAITRLLLRVEQVGQLDFSFTFSDGASLYITGNDRDAVFLLFSDLREYMNNEVLIVPPLSKETTDRISVMIMAAGVLFMFYVFYSTIVGKDPALLKAALDSTEVNEKLDFLIKNGEAPIQGRFIFWVPVAMFIAFAIPLDLIGKVRSFIFPTNQFLFGDRKKKYEARVALVSKIFWGVGVTLIVSIIAGFFVWTITA